MTQAANIKPGDKIILRDGKTIVSVIDTSEIPNVFPDAPMFIALFWLWEGERRHMAYAPTENIEVRE